MKKLHSLLVTFSSMTIAYMLPVNKIIGSIVSSFSFSSVIAPVTSFYAGLPMLLLFIVTKGFIFSKSLSLFVLANKVPTLAGAYVYNKKSFVASVLLPLAAVALFVVHPIGMQAAWYSLFWFIPVVFYVAGYEGIFVRAFQATFVAHAVGSIVWLYGHGLTPAIWLGLIPVVFVERCLIALSIVGFHFVVSSAMNYYKKKATI